MIKFLKQYEGKTFEELVNSLIWFDLPLKLKAVFAKLQEIIDGLGSNGVQSILGDSVDNTDPLNPIINDSRPYKVYTALLTQTGTNAPAATVLENTLGFTISYQWMGTGTFRGVRTLGNFDPSVTTIILSNSASSSNAAEIGLNSPNFALTSYNNTSNSYENSLLVNNFLEIRIYN